MKSIMLSLIGAAALIGGVIAALAYPEAKLTIKVLDEESKPVEAADVGIGFQIMSKRYFGNEEIEVRGQTNTEGEFTGSARADSNLGFTVRKAAYYETTGKYDFKEPVAEKWQPWNPTVGVILKKVGTPVAMYAKKVDLAMPAFDVPVGFDLVIGDWVGPHGKGKTPDLVFTAHLQERNKKDFNYELIVTFSNPADGLQPFDAPRFYGSKMKSVRFAPENGYLPEWRQQRKRVSGTAEVSNASQSRNYLLRVRTVMDRDGGIVSGLYGKIYGDFLRFTYYLNPVANDPSLEFDPNRNLFRELPAMEQVRDP